MYSSRKGIADIPTWRQYFETNKQMMDSLDRDLLEVWDKYKKYDPINDVVSIYEGDITRLRVGAIVNSARNSLMGGSGVDGAIHRAAGPELAEDCKYLLGCETGKAKITRSYKLPCSRVIHTVGPIGEQPDLLKSCYENCLKLAIENNIRTIAFPCISTGIYGYPDRKAAVVALRTVREFLEVNWVMFDRVIFCLFRKMDVLVYEPLMQIFFPVE